MKCFDAADDVVNGDDDLLDMAPMRTKPWEKVPADATATLAISEAAAANVRLFKRGEDGSYVVFDPASATLSAAELKAGVDMYLEGKDIIRDSSAWDGFVDVHIVATVGDRIVDEDKVRLKVAPVISPNHLDAPEQVYTTAGDPNFNADVAASSTAAKLPKPIQFKSQDVWAQDFFDPAYMVMPGEGGKQHVMHANFRSANFTQNTFRAAGKVVFDLRGKDVAAIVAYDPRHNDNMDSLNSFGNMETIPPYTLAGKSFPYGRILRGHIPTWYADPTFTKMIESQGVQDPIYVDTEWLIVGHVDEFLTYIPVSSPRGWALVVADATMARKMLQDLSARGLGATKLHEGLSVWNSSGSGRVSAMKTVAQVLADQDVMSASQLAQGKIDKALTIIRDAVGLTDAEIIRVPTLFESEMGAAVAWDPGTVNGIVLGNRFAAPKAHSAIVEGKDIVQKAFEDALVPRGMVVDWVEDWDTYHINLGEVHCGSNVRRTPPAKPFWMQGVKR